MFLLSNLRRLYSVDTLDTRFSTPSTGLQKRLSPDAADLRRKTPQPDPAKAEVAATLTNAPRWQTPEFFVYYVIFIVVVPTMFKIAYDVSKGQ